MVKQRVVKKRVQQAQKPQKKKTSKFLVTAGFLLPVLMLVLLVMLYSSYRAQKNAGTGTERMPVGTDPEVASARILPERPMANMPLTVEYQGREPEGVPVQYTIRWHVEGGIVQEGASTTLEAGSVRKGESVFVEIIPTSANGQGKPFKSEPVRIANIPPSITSLSLTPAQPVPGSIITAAASAEDSDRDEVSLRYVWTVNGEPVQDLPPDTGRFDTRKLRKKDNVSVTVTPTDGEDDGRPVLSEIVEMMNSAPKITSMPPTVMKNGIYTYQVAATDPDGDKIAFSLVQAPEGMTIDPAAGLIRWEPPRQVAERTEIAIKIKADDGDGGSVFQEYSLFLQ